MAGIAAGVVFGRWKLIERIGQGHSSVVWKAANTDGRNAAIKLLKKKYITDERTYERVKNEVLAMKACADIPGVLPLWDGDTPDAPKRDGDAWLAFPLATRMSERREVDIDEAVRICADLASTLSQMHIRGYFHRDIKPQNIVFWEGRWHLGDFGIAAGPELSRQTQPGEKLGPTFYIAPEMLNNSTGSNGGPADVYSLAKLLWKLVTGQTFPVPGVQLRDHPALNASGYVTDRRAHALDALLESATQVEPDRRPSMTDFARSLAAWFEPTPEPTGLLDLTPLKKAVANIVEPVQSEERRRGRLTTSSVGIASSKTKRSPLGIRGYSSGNACILWKASRTSSPSEAM